MTQRNRNIWIILMVGYASYVTYLLFFANRFFDLNWIVDGGWARLQAAMEGNINLTLFATINNYLYKLSIGYVGIKTVWVNLVGNFVVFMPFSLFFPLIYPKMKRRLDFYRFWLITLVLVEILQYLTMSGALDVDDILLNFAGLLLVFELVRYRIQRNDTLR